jgi:hypothetical protein
MELAMIATTPATIPTSKRPERLSLFAETPS